MKTLNTIVSNYDTETGDYPEGSYRNNPGDNVGNSTAVKLHKIIAIS